jgi:hypothetical protein
MFSKNLFGLHVFLLRRFVLQVSVSHLTTRLEKASVEFAKNHDFVEVKVVIQVVVQGTAELINVP